MDAPLRQTNLCLLFKQDQILLAMKKRGFGAGKWNGCGGKLHDGETMRQAAVREIKEEIGVDCAQSDLQAVAMLNFYFNDKPEWDNQCHVFKIENWQGEPAETEEMRPQWFAFDQIPYEQMWIDDKFWLPKIISGKKLQADFYFSEQGNALEKIDIKEM